MDAGGRALLLPMPMFFRYEQQDLETFCSHLSGTLRAPCLLYNLPAFTNGLTVETIARLLRNEAFVVGVKDSSGVAANLDALAGARGTTRGRFWSATIVSCATDWSQVGMAAFPGLPDSFRSSSSACIGASPQDIWTRPRGFRVCSTS